MNITCDNYTTNLAMIKSFGANCESIENQDVMDSSQVCLDLQNCLGKSIVFIADSAHCLKLIRNNVAKFNVMKKDGNEIKWDYYKLLYNKQIDEGYHLATKLKLQHILFYRDIMRTRLAAQTFSKSNAIAFDTLRVNLKDKAFLNSEETSKLTRVIDKAWDILNSKNRRSSDPCKEPLTNENFDSKVKDMQEITDYISSITDVAGKPIIKSSKKIGFVGFLLAFKSLTYLYKTYVQEGPLDYLLTFKFSQDHLETHFSAIRASVGCSNNPTTEQFKASYKKLMLGAFNKWKAGNVSLDIEHHTLGFSSNTKLELNLEKVEEKNLVQDEVETLINENELHNDELNEISKLLSNISEYKMEVFIYTSGYIHKKIMEKEKCIECISCMGEGDGITGHLIPKKDYGRCSLIKPKSFMVEVVKTTHAVIISKGDSLTKIKNPVENIVSEVVRLVFWKNPSFMRDFHHVNGCNHRISMVSKISKIFTAMKLRYQSVVENAVKNNMFIRNTLNKKVLLNSQ